MNVTEPPPEAAALRETLEKVGIGGEDIELVGPLIQRHQAGDHSFQSDYLFDLANIEVEEPRMNDLIGNCPAVEPARTVVSLDLTEMRSRMLGDFEALLVGHVEILQRTLNSGRIVPEIVGAGHPNRDQRENENGPQTVPVGRRFVGRLQIDRHCRNLYGLPIEDGASR
jgi:hypothetical protein